MEKQNKFTFGTVFFSILSIVWVMPIFVVLINSFKKKTYISKMPFSIPTDRAFVKLQNYVSGIKKIDFFQSFGYSLWITVASVAVIILCTSMCAWYITRVKSTATSALYYLCVFSMIVPFHGYVYALQAGGHDEAGKSAGYRHRLPWLRGRACGIHVLRLCQVDSD